VVPPDSPEYMVMVVAVPEGEGVSDEDGDELVPGDPGLVYW